MARTDAIVVTGSGAAPGPGDSPASRPGGAGDLPADSARNSSRSGILPVGQPLQIVPGRVAHGQVSAGAVLLQADDARYDVGASVLHRSGVGFSLAAQRDRRDPAIVD